jgi:DNA-binding MarR family transcriptional regulator
VDDESKSRAGREIARNCFAVRLRMLNRIVTGIYDNALRAIGLTVSQANMLTAIHEVGPVKQADLADYLHIEKSTLSRNLALMKKRGWVRALPGEDERSHTLVITAKGTKLLERSLPSWRKAQQAAVEILGDEGAATLKTVTDRYLPTL